MCADGMTIWVEALREADGFFGTEQGWPVRQQKTQGFKSS